MLLAVCIYTGANAQSTHVQFGVKGGLNFANVHTEDSEDALDNLTSFHLGALAHIHMTDRFALQPELFYSGQGAKEGDYKMKLGYLNLPVLGQVMFGEGFRIQTGPQIGYLMSAKADDEDVKDQFNKMDFSWVFGASYLTSLGLGIDARYNLGLSNINESDAYKVKNRVFSVGLFYQFAGK